MTGLVRATSALVRSIAAASLFFLIAGEQALAADGQDCPYPVLKSSFMPGIPMDTFYSEVKAQVPKSAGCESREPDTSCEFVDRFGYTNTFTSWTEVSPEEGAPLDRYLFLKTAVRARGGPLPYGVLWSDSRAAAMAKVRALGVPPIVDDEPDEFGFSVVGCWPVRYVDPFGTAFIYDRAGRLIEVRQSTLYP